MPRHDTGTYHCRSRAAERGQGGHWAGQGGPRGCAGGCHCLRGHLPSGCLQPMDGEWARQGRPGSYHPPSPSPSTHQAGMPPSQWHDGASEARGQCPVARQQPVHITRSAHSVAAEHVDGLVQVVLHLVLLRAWGDRVRGLCHWTLPSPMWPGSKHVPALATEPRNSAGSYSWQINYKVHSCQWGICPIASSAGHTRPNDSYAAQFRSHVKHGHSRHAKSSHGCLPCPRNGHPCACPPTPTPGCLHQGASSPAIQEAHQAVETPIITGR